MNKLKKLLKNLKSFSSKLTTLTACDFLHLKIYMLDIFTLEAYKNQKIPYLTF